MNGFFKQIFFVCLSLVGISLVCHAQPGALTEVTELWVGDFVQTHPLPWQGKMELLIRYQSGKQDPREIDGLIRWPTENKATTKVTGHKSWEKIVFQEDSCLSVSCSPIVTGGTYHGAFSSDYTEVAGKAELELLGLKGHFRLKRVFGKE